MIASAPDHGLGWCQLRGDATDNELVIKLPPEQVIRGRLLDLQGQPAKGVKLHVAEVGSSNTGSGTSTTGSTGNGGGSSSISSVPRPVADGGSDTKVPLAYDFPAARQAQRLAAGVTTDDDGRFVVRGLGKDQGVTLLVTDERFAPPAPGRQHGGQGQARGRRAPPGAGHWLEGTVVGEDSGKPIGKKVLLDIRLASDDCSRSGPTRRDFPRQLPAGPVWHRALAAGRLTVSDAVKWVDWPKGKTQARGRGGTAARRAGARQGDGGRVRQAGRPGRC